MNKGLFALLLLASHALAAPVRPPAPPDPLGKPFLGVTARPESDKIVVVEVHPGAAAFAAGIQSGDYILRLGSTTFEGKETADLIRTISHYRPGAVVEVECLRGEKKIVKRVRLLTAPNEPRP